MDPLPSTSPAPKTQPSTGSLEESIAGLRTVIHIALAALVVMTACMSLFLFKMTSINNKQVKEMQDDINRYEAQRPKMEQFVTSLQEYAKTDKDWEKVMVKYLGAVPQQTSPQPAPPATAPKAK